jgi:hypothetical protein
MAHGELTNPDLLTQSSLTTIQYIYDSQNKNLLCKEMLDEQRTLTSIWANNPHYSNLTWYTTRKYTAGHFRDLRDPRSCGDQFKVRLELNDDFKVVVKPDNVCFGPRGTDFLIKSAAMILPTEFVLKPKEYLVDGKPLIANKNFSIVYLNISSNRSLTIVHKQRYSALEDIDRALERSITASAATARFEGWQDRRSDSVTGVTRLECDCTILVPEARD